MASLMLTPCVTNNLVIIVDPPKSKPPSRISSPEASRTPSPTKIGARACAAEELHREALRQRREKAEALGSKRVERALFNRSEKEANAMRALASRMASAEEKRDQSRKQQIEKFERVRFLRQAAREARGKMQAARSERAESKAAMEINAAAKRAELLAQIAKTNAAKYHRCKEIGAAARAQDACERAVQLVVEKLEAHIAARTDKLEAMLTPVKAHNERVRSVANRAASERAAKAAEVGRAVREREARVAAKRAETIEATAAKAGARNEAARARTLRAAELAEAAKAETLRNMFARLQSARATRAAAHATPTKQAKARLDAKAHDIVLVNFAPAARPISPALAERLSECRTDAYLVAARMRAERRAIGATGRVWARRDLVRGLAKQHWAAVEAARARAVATRAAQAEAIGQRAARADARVIAIRAARTLKASAVSARRDAAARRRAAAATEKIARAAGAADAVRAARGRRATALAKIRAAAVRTEVKLAAASHARTERSRARAAASAKQSAAGVRASARRSTKLQGRVARARMLADRSRFGPAASVAKAPAAALPTISVSAD